MLDFFIINAYIFSMTSNLSHSAIPPDLLTAMISQFISFSLRRMKGEEDKALRLEMGDWPEKYWNFFPQSIRLLIADFLNGKMNEANFNNSLDITLQVLQAPDPSKRAKQEDIRPHGTFSCLLNKC